MSFNEIINGSIQAVRSVRLAQTGGTIKDDAVYRALMSDVRVKGGGVDFMEVAGTFHSNPRCRFPISGSRREMVICGDPVAKSSYCAVHYEMCYYPSSARAEGSALKAAGKEVTVTAYMHEPVVDLCGEIVEA